jgi:hypothetical protein
MLSKTSLARSLVLGCQSIDQSCQNFVAVGHRTGEDFYNRLERAIRASNAKLIEAKVIAREGD